MQSVHWRPISEANYNGTEYLLWFEPDPERPVLKDGGAIQGRWFASGKEKDDGWETVVGFIGKPLLFAEILFPPSVRAKTAMEIQALEMRIECAKKSHST